MEKHEVDRELKTLLRGEAVNVGGWVWSQSYEHQRPHNMAHDVLGLSSNNPDLEERLDLYNALLFAFGYKTDGLSSKAPGEQIPPENIESIVAEAVKSLDGNGSVFRLMADAGVLEHWHASSSDAGRLAAVVFALSR